MLTLPSLLHPLRHPVYRRMLAAQIIALSGTGLTTIALALLAWDLAGEQAGLVLGAALALKMVAYVGIAPLVGAIAHRLPRRNFLIALDLLRAGLVFCLPLVDAVWQILLLVFLVNGCSAGFTPVFQASIPDVLKDEEQYTRALSLSRLAYDLESLSSPLLAALLLGFVSFDALFALNGGAFLISAALLASLLLPSPAATRRPGGVWQNLSFGIQAYFRTPRLRALFALGWTIAAASAMIIVNSVMIVRDGLGLGERDLAFTYGAAGAGSMLTALLLPRLLGAARDREVMLAGGGLLVISLGSGALLPALEMQQSFGLILVLWFLLGVGLSMTQTPGGRLVRRSAAEADRPAFFAAQFSLSHFCWLACYPLAGWLGGEGLAFAGLAVIALAGLCAAFLLWPNPDRQTMQHSHPAMDHEHPHTHNDDHHQHVHQGWEGPEPHCHPHYHAAHSHRHDFVIDSHHLEWPRQG